MRGRHCHLAARCGAHCWSTADAAAEFDFACAEAVAGGAALAVAAAIEVNAVIFLSAICFSPRLKMPGLGT